MAERTKWFVYKQNNSAGVWHEPAYAVAVEALDKDGARSVAAAHGVDPDAPFCRCCGERWSLDYPSEYEAKPTAFDMIGNDAFTDFYRRGFKRDNVPVLLLVSLGGATETLRCD